MGVRVLTILSALVLIGGKDLFKVGTTSIFTHLLGVSLYLGVNFYTTFVLGITLFKNLPVQMFGRLQSKLFPMYFQLLSGCLVVLLSSRKAVGLPAGILSDVSSRNLLIVSLVCTLLNLFYLEPATTTNMFRRYEIENMKDATDRSANAGEYKKLRKSFAFLHGMSSFVNLLALVAGTVYAWDLSTSIAKVIEAAAVGSAVASEAGVSAAVAVMS